MAIIAQTDFGCQLLYEPTRLQKLPIIVILESEFWKVNSKNYYSDIQNKSKNVKNGRKMWKWRVHNDQYSLAHSVYFTSIS